MTRKELPLSDRGGGAFVVSEYTSNTYPVNASSGMFDEITRDDLPAKEMEDNSNVGTATDASIDDILRHRILYCAQAHQTDHLRNRV